MKQTQEELLKEIKMILRKMLDDCLYENALLKLEKYAKEFSDVFQISIERFWLQNEKIAQMDEEREKEMQYFYFNGIINGIYLAQCFALAAKGEERDLLEALQGILNLDFIYMKLNKLWEETTTEAEIEKLLQGCCNEEELIFEQTDAEMVKKAMLIAGMARGYLLSVEGTEKLMD